jgi:vacuolar protein sorting-associated protein 13A/C
VDLEEDARIEQATKQERLKSAEEVDNAASQVGAAAGSDQGMLSRACLSTNKLTGSGKQTYVGAIMSKVVDNVQIHVKNIHMRYEDGSSTPEVRSRDPMGQQSTDRL